MPVLVLLFLQAALAGWCAYRARAWLELRHETLGIPFLVPAAVACVFAGPAAVFMLRFHPAWFLHYVVDPSGQPLFDTMSFLASLALLLLVFGATVGGFLAVRYAVVRLHAPFCAAPAAILGMLGVLALLIPWRRSFHVGTLAAYHAGESMLLWKHRVGAAGLGLLLLGLLAGVLCGRIFRDDKSVAPRASVPSLPPVA